MKNRAVFFLPLAGILLTLALALQPTRVAAEMAFSVSPIRIQLTGDAGRSHSDSLEVRNEGSDPVRIKVQLQDWFLTEDGTPVFQPPASSEHSCAGWLKVNPVDFLLNPGQERIVRYSAAIPPETSDGGYWGAFLFETLPILKPGLKASSVSLKGNIASILYVTVGSPEVAGELTNMVFRETEAENELAVTLSNRGKVHFRTGGTVEIRSAEGEEASTLVFPDAPVLPGHPRTFTLALDRKLPSGKYTALATIDIGDGIVLAGELPF